MKFLRKISVLCSFWTLVNAEVSYGQHPGSSADNGIPVGVWMCTQTIRGKKAVRVVVDSNISSANSPTFVKIKGTNVNKPFQMYIN